MKTPLVRSLGERSQDDLRAGRLQPVRAAVLEGECLFGYGLFPERLDSPCKFQPMNQAVLGIMAARAP